METVDELTRIIAPVLKQLYPGPPDVVLGHEAHRIAEAIVAARTPSTETQRLRMMSAPESIPPSPVEKSR